MKKILLTLAAIPAATMAVEASAQSYYPTTNGAVGIQNRIANLEARYQAAVNARVLTENERIVIGRQLMQLRNMERQLGYNGLTTAERRQLQAQVRTVRDQLRNAGGTGWARNYGWNDQDLETYGTAYGSTYGNGYGSTYGNGYGNSYGNNGYTYDQYGRRIQVPTVTYDQYGRPVQNGYYGQGGPYEPVYQNRNSGIGGVIGSVLGGGRSGGGGVLGSILGGGGLSIGSVITGAIANALGGGSNYGYRDRNDVYFRTDGQRVYEIDARTNQVVRVHPVR